jgi:FkbM family methyltransferase
LSNLGRKVRAAIEMQQSVGAGPTFERITKYAQAQLLERQRNQQFKRLGLDTPQIRSILGSKMKLNPATPGLDRDLLLDGIREPVATGSVLNILTTEDIVLEVGANIGYYALMESRICKKVYAAEPHPGNFQRLQENIALNGYDNIEAFNIGFGEADAPLAMNCSELSNWHSCKDATTGAPGVIEVDGMRIDSFVENRQTPTFIKMDVEGFELQVLRGAEKTLSALDRLFIEIHGDILAADEIREVLDRIAHAGLRSSLIIQYDRPGLSRIYPSSQLEQIYAGDRGTFELFFDRQS